MRRSTERILTSHAGALHGTPAMIELAQRPGEAPPAEAAATVKQAVNDVVRLQSRQSPPDSTW